MDEQLLQHILAGMPGPEAIQLAHEWLACLALLHTTASDSVGGFSCPASGPHMPRDFLLFAADWTGHVIGVAKPAA